MKLLTCAVLLAVLFPHELRKEAQPITIDIYPRVVSAGVKTAEVKVEWRIARHPDNIGYSFVMAGVNGAYSFTSGQLDGENDQVTFPTCTEDNLRPCFRTVRAGVHVFEACVYRKHNVRFCARQKVDVK